MKVKLQGYVILEAILGKDGDIRDIKVLRGLGKGRFGFEDAATEALKKWQFLPGRLHGKPSDVRMTLKIDFVLQTKGDMELLDWMVTGGRPGAIPPRVIQRAESDGTKDPRPFASVPVTVNINDLGELENWIIEPKDLEPFAWPERVQLLIDNKVINLKYKPATRQGEKLHTTIRFKLNVPLTE